MENINFNQLKESIKMINLSLEKGCKNGVYNLDESYLIKVSLNNITSFIESAQEVVEQKSSKETILPEIRGPEHRVKEAKLPEVGTKEYTV